MQIIILSITLLFTTLIPFQAQAKDAAPNVLLIHAEEPVIGIMGVDFDELGNLLSFMTPPLQITSQGMRNSYRGKLWGVDTVIFVSHEEKAAASSAVVEMTLQQHVDAIIFMGTAGALDNRLNIGDVVCPKSLIQFDVDFRPYAPLYQIPLLESREFPTHGLLRNLAIESATEFFQKEMENAIPPETRTAMHISKPKANESMVATGDCFLISEKQLTELHNNAPEVLSIEMEGAAAAQTARDYGIPFILIRTIANYIDTPSSTGNDRVALDYKKFLKEVQWAYSEGILKGLYARIGALCKQRVGPADGCLQPADKTDAASPLGILCTLPDEVEALTQLFEGPVEITAEGNRQYYKGKIKNTPVVAAASGIGKAAAAAAATDMIIHHHIGRLMNIGSANSLDEELEIGDVVISKNLVEHDVDVRPFRPVFEISTINVTELPADKPLRDQIVQKVALALRDEALTAGSLHPHQAKIGQIASGDCFVSDKQRLQFLQYHLPHASCLDSEAAPAAQIAYQYGIPYVAIKTISEHSSGCAPFCENCDTRKEHCQTIRALVDKILPL